MPDLDTYQASVRRLTAENQALKEQLRAEKVTHRRELQEVRGQLAEGLTPELLVLRRELSKWRTRAQAAEARLKQVRRIA